jgi:hypothetical protein
MAVEYPLMPPVVPSNAPAHAKLRVTGATGQPVTLFLVAYH